MKRSAATSTVETKRVAVYTRQSVERETNGDFGSIEAQRQAVLSYIESQRGLGWEPLDTVYDDRGISGSTADRPALKRLIQDVEARKIDVVACYKLDRLSRSIFDFSRLMALFDEHDVAFVSVTQQFNSATSVGRLTLNLLGTFAQFEREQIAERTADKIGASRRKGLWTGGKPLLGFDAVDGKLAVNEVEAEDVRTIFDAYLREGTIPRTLAFLRSADIRNKRWRNRAGVSTGGRPFDTVSLRTLLQSPLPAGRIRAGDKIVPAAHRAIVEPSVYDAVQKRMAERSRIHAAQGRPLKPWGALLGGLITCARCDARMGHVWSSRGARKWRYYYCRTAQRKGAAACSNRVSAVELEDSVARKLRAIGSDADLARRILDAARARVNERLDEISAELAAMEGAGAGSTGDDATAAEERRRARIDELRDERRELNEDGGLDGEAVRHALANFDGLWTVLKPDERRRLVTLLVKDVRVDAAGGTIELRLRDRALRAVVGRASNAGESSEEAV